MTTLTKKMAEDLTALPPRTRHPGAVHARRRVGAMERMEIIRDLRLGEFDVLVGINLLREGLDLPEVSLVAILDADKEGFLRSETSLIQTIGRAARNAEGLVILYADTITPSMRAAMDETERRRKLQDDLQQGPRHRAPDHPQGRAGDGGDQPQRRGERPSSARRSSPTGSGRRRSPGWKRR